MSIPTLLSECLELSAPDRHCEAQAYQAWQWPAAHGGVVLIHDSRSDIGWVNR
jgi:hypothetical protein